MTPVEEGLVMPWISIELRSSGDKHLHLRDETRSINRNRD